MHRGQHKFRNLKQNHSTANNVANLCEILLSIYELVFVLETKKTMFFEEQKTKQIFNM